MVTFRPGLAWRRTLLLAVAAAMTAAAALAIGILRFGDFGGTEGRVLRDVFGTAALGATELLILTTFPPLVWGADELRRAHPRRRRSVDPRSVDQA